MNELYPELELPPTQKPGSLRIIPLGGLGEVGRNMTVLEYEGQILLIDCGVLFPEENQPGVDLILPDFSYLEDKIDQVVGLVLTHGHEDHIGAVPYLLRLRADIPIYGSELTLSFLSSKLQEHRLADDHLQVVRESERVQVGEFECEFLAVTHSVPDALAVMVRCGAGNVLLTGDFKMDQLPLDGRVTDLRAFARMGDEGVDLFMVDSTNAEVPGFIPPEKEIGPTIERIFSQSAGQIIVASFASHVHRVQQVLDAADKTGRKVCLNGRSMERNMRIAAEKGYLNLPEGVVVGNDIIASLPAEKRVYMVTGSQGEPMAALARIANGQHRFIELSPQDTVLLASSLIPGNENAVNRVINQLIKSGANVVHKGNAKVHVSGHAAQGELLYAYNIVSPRNVMPIHGEIRHLVANAKLAAQTGVPQENIALAEDGVVVDLYAGKAQVVGKVPCELVYVDGRSVGDLEERVLKVRMNLSSEGFVSVFAVVDTDCRLIVAGPHITARAMAEDEAVFREVLPDVTEALERALKEGVSETYRLQQVMRRALGSWIARRLNRRPMILPVVIEIQG